MSKVFVQKWLFRPGSASCAKNNVRDINYMPVFIFFHFIILHEIAHFWTDTSIAGEVLQYHGLPEDKNV